MCDASTAAAAAAAAGAEGKEEELPVVRWVQLVMQPIFAASLPRFHSFDPLLLRRMQLEPEPSLASRPHHLNPPAAGAAAAADVPADDEANGGTESIDIESDVEPSTGCPSGCGAGDGAAAGGAWMVGARAPEQILHFSMLSAFSNAQNVHLHPCIIAPACGANSCLRMA